MPYSSKIFFQKQNIQKLYFKQANPGLTGMCIRQCPFTHTRGEVTARCFIWEERCVSLSGKSFLLNPVLIQVQARSVSGFCFHQLPRLNRLIIHRQQRQCSLAHSPTVRHFIYGHMSSLQLSFISLSVNAGKMSGHASDSAKLNH